MSDPIMDSVTCEVCGRLFLEKVRRYHCDHCNKYYHVCDRCKKAGPKCPYCGVPLKRRAPETNIRKK